MEGLTACGELTCWRTSDKIRRRMFVGYVAEFGDAMIYSWSEDEAFGCYPVNRYEIEAATQGRIPSAPLPGPPHGHLSFEWNAAEFQAAVIATVEAVKAAGLILSN